MPPDTPGAEASASWRDRIAVHPAADLFPPMSDTELQQLGEDIKKHGLRVPVVFFGDRTTLIDGRNRLDAMERAGLSIFDTSGNFLPSSATVENVDPVAYVVSANLRRRHLTAESGNSKQRGPSFRSAGSPQPHIHRAAQLPERWPNQLSHLGHLTA